MLRSNPSLNVFPIISAIFTLFASAPFVAAMALGDMAHGKENFGPLHYSLMFGMYFVDYFIIIFFNSALVACAHANLQGQPATVSYGIQKATERLPQILGWTLIASTVGTVLRAISERSGLLGAIVSGIIGIAWNVAVFFVVPLLVIEKLSPMNALKESAIMLKRSWGERIILGIGVSYAMLVMMILGVVPAVMGVFLLVQSQIFLGVLAIGCAVLYFLMLSVVMSSLNVIFQTALYMYCRTGEVPAAYSPDSIQMAFREKPQNKFFGR